MTLPLVPLPSSVESLPGDGFRLTAATLVVADEAGTDAARALVDLVRVRTGLELRVARPSAGGATDPATGSATDPATASAADPATDSATGSASDPAIELRIDAPAAAESYRLRADAASLVVSGADAAGLFYGVQTLGQLLAPSADGWSVPPVEIDDAPRFPYRGVMLDVARHFHDVETVRAFIDRAASLKFNHLHLHLADDQGWRLQITSRPELTERAAGTSIAGVRGGFFTTEDYRGIVAYAASRHMTVVPEIDGPGHTHAVSLAYPELSEAPVIPDDMRERIAQSGGAAPENGSPYEGMEVGFSSLRIGEEATYDFLRDVFGELAELTPGPYLHVGGDEALGTDAADFAVYLRRVTALVAELGKTPIAWHEAGAVTGLASGTIGQYWSFVEPDGGSDAAARAFVAGGGRVILSPADAVYLDMKFDADSPLGLTWAGGVTSLERAYAWEPATVVDGIGEAQILGVEAPLWTETVPDLAAIDALVFPRIGAAAEAAWSPAVGTRQDRTYPSFRDRVAGLAPLWRALGIRFTPLPDVEWEESA